MLLDLLCDVTHGSEVKMHSSEVVQYAHPSCD